MSAPIFSVRHLEKRYRGVVAVDGVSFDVAAGTITGLIGPNGSGKSTTIDCITGFQKADGGAWSLEGRSLAGQSAHAHALAGLARTFQAVRAYENFTLVDNLAVAAQARDRIGWTAAFFGTAALREAEASARARARELIALVGLAPYADAPASVLSYGQRKLLAIAATMMGDPKLVVLDEPVAGINPTMIRRVEDAILALNARGTTILVVEHNMDFIMRLCSRVIVLVGGRLLTEGTPDTIQADPRVLDAYLGHGHVAEAAE
jgi:branched-chain amino acid transport system ATP-binding protein